MDGYELFANLLVGSVGAGLFVYGRKQRRWPQAVTGVLLCAGPFVGGGTATLLTGAGLVAAMTIAVRLGL